MRIETLELDNNIGYSQDERDFVNDINKVINIVNNPFSWRATNLRDAVEKKNEELKKSNNIDLSEVKSLLATQRELHEIFKRVQLRDNVNSENNDYRERLLKSNQNDKDVIEEYLNYFDKVGDFAFLLPTDLVFIINLVEYILTIINNIKNNNEYENILELLEVAETQFGNIRNCLLQHAINLISLNKKECIVDKISASQFGFYGSSIILMSEEEKPDEDFVTKFSENELLLNLEYTISDFDATVIEMPFSPDNLNDSNKKDMTTNKEFLKKFIGCHLDDGEIDKLVKQNGLYEEIFPYKFESFDQNSIFTYLAPLASVPIFAAGFAYQAVKQSVSHLTSISYVPTSISSFCQTISINSITDLLPEIPFFNEGQSSVYEKRSNEIREKNIKRKEGHANQNIDSSKQKNNENNNIKDFYTFCIERDLEEIDIYVNKITGNNDDDNHDNNANIQVSRIEEEFIDDQFPDKSKNDNLDPQFEIQQNHVNENEANYIECIKEAINNNFSKIPNENKNQKLPFPSENFYSYKHLIADILNALLEYSSESRTLKENISDKDRTQRYRRKDQVNALVDFIISFEKNKEVDNTHKLILLYQAIPKFIAAVNKTHNEGGRSHLFFGKSLFKSRLSRKLNSIYKNRSIQIGVGLTMASNRPNHEINVTYDHGQIQMNLQNLIDLYNFQVK